RGIGLVRRRQRAHRHALGLRRADRYRQYATELVALVPDVLVAATSLVAAALQRETRSVPIAALCRDATKRQFDVVMAWNVDRLGRSLKDLVAFLSELHALGIDLFLHQQGLDTTTPAGKAMFQMLGVFAEFEHSIIQERVRAGLQ